MGISILIVDDDKLLVEKLEETVNWSGIGIDMVFTANNIRQAQKLLEEYADPTSDRYESMCQEICRRQNFTSLRYHRLDDLVESIGLPKCKMCTYCFDGKE